MRLVNCVLHVKGRKRRRWRGAGFIYRRFTLSAGLAQQTENLKKKLWAFHWLCHSQAHWAQIDLSPESPCLAPELLGVWGSGCSRGLPQQDPHLKSRMRLLSRNGTNVGFSDSCKGILVTELLYPSAPGSSLTGKFFHGVRPAAVAQRSVRTRRPMTGGPVYRWRFV